MIDSQQGGTSAEAGPVKPTSGIVFRFDAQQIVRAITFHLLDSKLAQRVGRQSVKRTLTRLSRELRNLAVPREEWIAMTDPQRLNWLLEESKTAVEMLQDGTAMLRHGR